MGAKQTAAAGAVPALLLFAAILCADFVAAMEKPEFRYSDTDLENYKDEVDERVRQMGKPFGRGKEDKAPAVMSDIPYIRCGTCEAIAKQAIKITRRLRDEAEAKYKRLDEADIIDKLENMCNPDNEVGEWISHHDLKEDGTKLKLVDMLGMGECGTECRTIAKACDQVLDAVDLSDLSEVLWKGRKQRAQLTQWLCYEASDACRKKTPALPADRAPGPEFQLLDTDEAGRKRSMRNMKNLGMSGTMYEQAEVLKKLQELKELGIDITPGATSEDMEEEEEQKAVVPDKGEL